ncbi:unnamed protein product [Arabis nemorensis]|uniref:Nucleoside diphosphate kinase n=1 Tax=Arabis nemorensis TaxID=586526 RepID=A0A565BZK9_9BRAS|nr:unnamed protein product [Arabis nemorensis]
MLILLEFEKKKNVVLTGRKIIGATNPAASEPGTIRGDFAIDIGRNVIHGSDSVESANKESALWIPDGPVNWQSSLHPWIYDFVCLTIQPGWDIPSRKTSGWSSLACGIQ